jgi:hypothetical protein
MNTNNDEQKYILGLAKDKHDYAQQTGDWRVYREAARLYREVGYNQMALQCDIAADLLEGAEEVGRR